MIPVLVAPPAEPPIGLEDTKAFLRISGAAEDALVDGIISGVVAELDGWHGLLGRAIMPQTWRVEVRGYGPFLLPMPDVSEVLVEAGGAAVAPENVSLSTVGAGVLVEVASDAAAYQIDFTCGLPEARLPAALALIKMMIAHRYGASRDPVAIGTIAQEVPLGASSLIGSLRWIGEYAR